MSAPKPARAYAWRPDTPDHRDHRFAMRVPRGGLPLYIPTVASGVRVEDQGDLGSCTGHASTTALEVVTGADQLSRLMAYYNGRRIDGTTRSDAGAEIRSVIKGLTTWGVARERLWPYKPAKFRTRPSGAAYADAQWLPAAGLRYSRVTTLTELHVALAGGFPVVFGFTVPASFEGDAVARSGWAPLPTNAEKTLGGHAVVAVGLDFRRLRYPPCVLVRNSWGRAWGLQGDFMMPVEWFTDRRRLVDDMWVIHP